MSNNKSTILVGENVPFSRIRRITGYLVGDMDRWNDAKRAEEKDRVKHLEAGEVFAAQDTKEVVAQKIDANTLVASEVQDVQNAVNS